MNRIGKRDIEFIINVVLHMKTRQDEDVRLPKNVTTAWEN